MKYEYISKLLRTDVLETQLTFMGNAGWQLVFCKEPGIFWDTGWFCIFMREAALCPREENP